MGDIHTSPTSNYITSNPLKLLVLLRCFASSTKSNYWKIPLLEVYESTTKEPSELTGVPGSVISKW